MRKLLFFTQDCHRTGEKNINWFEGESPRAHRGRSGNELHSFRLPVGHTGRRRRAAAVAEEDQGAAAAWNPLENMAYFWGKVWEHMGTTGKKMEKTLKNMRKSGKIWEIMGNM